jgi:hypothetical protein
MEIPAVALKYTVTKGQVQGLQERAGEHLYRQIRGCFVLYEIDCGPSTGVHEGGRHMRWLQQVSGGWIKVS